MRQLVLDVTHFERLGLAERFDLPPAEVEAAFLAASRAVHPDHHAGGADDAAAVNAAYQTLRDPLRRAEYLLGIRGGPAAGPQDQAFLMDVMELRERQDTERAAVAAELSERLAALPGELARLFAAGDLAGVRKTLDAGRTLTSLRREAESD